MSVIKDLKNVFRSQDNGLMQIIVINCGVFLLLNLINSIANKDLGNYLALNSSIDQFPAHFFPLITYMFLHKEFLHLLFNMLWLHSMGKIFVEYLGSKRLVITYIFGGIAGGVLFLIVSNLIPYLGSNTYLLGASAGVMAVIVAIATLIPDYTIQLILLGPIRLKHLALVAFLLTTVVDITNNTGGKIAHLGGALFGYIYVLQYKKGNDLSRWCSNVANKVREMLSPKNKNLKVVHKRRLSDEEYNANKIEEQKVIDEILDKISKSGYESLRAKEKEILFKASK